jgi:glycogen(starch) synthase
VLPKIRKCVPASAFRVEGAAACYREHLCLRADVDVIEAPDWMAAGSSRIRRRRPLVAHLHTPLLIVGRTNPVSFQRTRDRRLAAVVERLTAKRADLVTSPSRRPAADLVGEGWLGDGEPRTIRSPWEGEVVGHASAGGILTVVRLPVGRLEAQKVPEILVRAVSLLVHGVPSARDRLRRSVRPANGAS